MPLAWEERACRRSCPRRGEDTFLVKKTARHPRSPCPLTAVGSCPRPGRYSCWEPPRSPGLGAVLSAGLARWCAPRAVHDPGKILTGLVIACADRAGHGDPSSPETTESGRA